MSRISDIAERYVEDLAALHPIAATSLGIPGHEDELGDFSPLGAERDIAFVRRTLADLDAAATADESERDRIAREALAERLRLSLEEHEAGEHFRALNILASPLQSLRRVFDLMSRDSEDDWRHVAHRMAAVGEALGGYRQTLTEGIERGLTSTQRQARECAVQAGVWSGEVEGQPSFFAGLVDAFDASGAPGGDTLRREIETGATAASDAYAEMGRWLGDHYLARADEHDGVGVERYRLSARTYLGAEIDLDETYRWGWDEMHRVERELTATSEVIAPGAGLEAAIELLETDPERAIEGVDAFQRWMQDLQDRTVEELNGRHFDLPEPVRRIEAMIAPPGGALAMYYTGPSEDFSRPGRTWYPTGGKTRFPLWGEVSIAYHEGVPGHHLQIAMTRYLRDELTRVQRLMLTGTSGYSEGWGLYAERLMAELGYLEVPDYQLGLLRSQALRSARVVVDIGLHLGLPIALDDPFHPGETWTPELAHEFMVTRSHWPADFLSSEVTRYLGLPGQAISYKVGERMWLAAREQARTRDGADFDLKRWHSRALGLGPMGLEQMQRELGAA
ncbi:MAG: DUF885 domain-containing protein [Dehalococcoidia bacterium]